MPRRLLPEQRQWRFGGPGRAPVQYSAIRGAWFLSIDLLWPAVVWNGGRCWAYLHDLDNEAAQMVLDALRDAELGRSHPHGVPRF